MLAKLLKHDLKIMYKYLIFFYAIFITCAILCRICYKFNTTTFIFVVGQIFQGATIGFIIGAVINNGMHIWEYLRSDFYGDRSYLTHTLPVARTTLYLSKFLTVLITSFTTLIFSLMAIFIINGTPEFFNILRDLSNALGDTGSFIKYVILFCLTLYLEFVFIIQCGTTGLILGHRFTGSKLLTSVLLGFGIFTIANFITIILLLFWSAFDPQIAAIFTDNEIVTIDIIDKILSRSILIYAIYISTTYYLSAQSLKRGIDVD